MPSERQKMGESGLPDGCDKPDGEASTVVGGEMRAVPTVERHRVVEGRFATPAGSGPQGAFLVPGPLGDTLWIMASDARDWDEAARVGGFDANGPRWEHVSVHAGKKRPRCPTWAEMEYVREAFWEDDATVVQFSVPRSKHISIHPHTLHLWREIGAEVHLPPERCV